MKLSYKNILTVLCVVYSNYAFNQNIVDTTTIKTEKTPPPSEITRTPEEQGYMKYIINGEVIYRKEEEQISFEYKPNKL